jgi:hypothetical protein
MQSIGAGIGQGAQPAPPPIDPSLMQSIGASFGQAPNPQPPPPQAPQMPQMGQAPPAGPTGLAQPLSGVAGVLDRMILGGAVDSERQAHNAWLAQQYQMQQLGNRLASLPPSERVKAAANLQGYFASQDANVTAKPDETVIGPAVGGGIFRAGNSGINETTQQPWQRQFQYTPPGGAPTVGGQFSAGPALGGGKPTVATNGLITAIPTPDNPTGVLGVSDVTNPASGQSMAPRAPYFSGGAGAGGSAGGYMWNPNGPTPIAQRGGGPPAAGPSAPPPSATLAASPSFKSAIALVESHGNPNALNQSTGAAGLYQVTPKRFGGPIPNAAAANAFGEQNLDATLAKYNGDTDRAAVDWFSGPGNVAPPGSPTPWLRNTSDGNMHVSQYVANVRRNMGAGGSSQGAQAGAQPAVSVPGTTSNGGPIYTIKHGSEVAGGDPSLDYKVNTATGEMAPISRSVTAQDVVGRGQQFMSSKVYEDGANVVNALNGLSDGIKNVGPSGAVSMAVLDSTLRTLNPGLGVKGQQLTLNLEHMGMPQEIASKYQEFMGQGFMPAKVAAQYYRVAYGYAKAHLGLLSQQHEANQTWAKQAGYDPAMLGETMPQMGDVPQSAQDAIPPSGQRKVGNTYWTPKGPAKWTGKGWVQ